MKREAAAPESSYQAIYRVIRAIPEGKVATYGQVAALAGLPGHARQVGYALNVLPDRSDHPESEDVPWQRVINAKGEVSLRSPNAAPGREGYQRHLLEEEGIELDLSGRVDLRRFAWDPSLQEVRRLQKPQPSKKPQRSTKRRSATPAGGVSRRSATDERRKG